jgi:hypothetical protein
MQFGCPSNLEVSASELEAARVEKSKVLLVEQGEIAARTGKRVMEK